MEDHHNQSPCYFYNEDNLLCAVSRWNDTGAWPVGQEVRTYSATKLVNLKPTSECRWRMSLISACRRIELTLHVASEEPTPPSNFSQIRIAVKSTTYIIHKSLARPNKNSNKQEADWPRAKLQRKIHRFAVDGALVS